MFDALQYSRTIAPLIPEIQKVYSASGIAEIDELLQDIRAAAHPVLMVEDSCDGVLSLESGNYADEYNTVWFLDRVKLNDSPDRRRAQELCFGLALKYFKQMKADGQNFGDATYGFEPKNITFNRVGPIGNHYYGYAFSFIVRNENISLP